MIITEFYKTRNDGINLYHTYSDIGMKIRQIETGIEYNDAIDVEDLHTYEETENSIDEEELSDSEASNIIMGGTQNE